MARILSDTIIVAMIEAATRLASGRGPITGSNQPAGGTAETAAGATSTDEKGATVQAAGEPGGTGVTTSTTTHSPDAMGQGGSEHDTRSAAQIAADFKTIYTQLEDLVRTSAEQETRSVGFGIR